MRENRGILKKFYVHSSLIEIRVLATMIKLHLLLAERKREREGNYNRENKIPVT